MKEADYFLRVQKELETDENELSEALEAETSEVNSEVESEPRKEKADSLLEARAKRLEEKVLEYEAKFDDARSYIKKMEEEVAHIRARSARDQQKAIDQKTSDFFMQIIPVVDNFELSLKAVEKETGPLVDGVRMIHRQFQEVLKKAGLEKVETKGMVFDPNFHEALTMMTVQDESQDGHIIDEVKAGYKFKDQVVRPAQVIVGRKSDDTAND